MPRHTPRARLARLGLSTMAAASVLGLTTSAATASSKSAGIRLSGRVIAISTASAKTTLWVLTARGSDESISQISLVTGKSLGHENVSPDANDVAISPNGATLALGTTGGAFPATVWYSALTGRFTNASRSPVPVSRVAVNASGNTIYTLRGTGTEQSAYALGTANGLGYNYLIPGDPVDLAATASGKTLEVLQADGMVGQVDFATHAYTNQFSSGGPARAMALTADGATLYVLRAAPVSGAKGSVAEIDMATGQVTKTLSVPADCVDISLAPTGRELFEALRTNTVSTLTGLAVP